VRAARDTGLLLAEESEASLRQLFKQILEEANRAYPSEDLRDDPGKINAQQWRAMMRTAVVDKRHKVDETAFSLKSRAKVAKKGPYGVKVEAGRTYYWCSCGMSKTQPFCDGSHGADTTEFSCEFQPVKYVAEETRTVWFCGCKQTSSPPMCDGTHTSL
jgi:CDGSH-type Zn-finger protein